ncbi:RNA polymerase sigma factor [Azoarcus olearius]|uniref:Probable RNA polymerase sigma factor n=1 Tax=Azoarcus sp. (strain BH72) TaxID=418699 RepID=A1KAB4_AZOSB|nr:RNA polymerase sigma factor [Azoarcus olearius]ANQ86312.1 RNA polymerase sigma factor [Azoarcus olearius]CAL95770.1 probable RNA polymerase sigma factor [Azoarcus olearius]
MTGLLKDLPLASRVELSAFLAGVEKRAFKQAVWSLRDEEAALDAVQDAMLKLSSRYGDRPADELPMLFQRILQNVVLDMHRRLRVRRTWVSPLSSLQLEAEEDNDPLDTLAADCARTDRETPHAQFERKHLLGLLEREIARLPNRQREAFLLRYWEEMDIAETAAAMGCSEGSVKTHCSRATHTLAAALKARGVGL